MADYSQMKKQDALFLGALGALAAFVWLRDRRWWDDLGDSLPILVALPLFVGLRAPWAFRPAPWRLAPAPAFVAAALFPLGIVVDSGLVLALAWTALLGSWIYARVVESPAAATAKLLVLPVLAFPWLITDLERVAWWFRLSGAASAGAIMEFSGFSVVREGTLLWVNGFAVSVEPACSGVNGLQSILVAGAAVAWFKLRHTSLFWFNLPVLVGAAWGANLLRILAATWAGALLEPAVAARWVGPLHSFAGWLALCAVFVGCYALFTVEERAADRGWRWLAERPWLEMILLASAAWSARGLVPTWVWTPYDRLGWLAFALWLAPVLRRPRAPHPQAMREGLRVSLLAAGLLTALLGRVADINFLHHASLAFLIASTSRRAGFVIWTAGAVAWMPVAGWIGSRLGFEPAAFAGLRVLVAGGAAVWGLGWLHRPRAQFATSGRTVLALVPGRADHAR